MALNPDFQKREKESISTSFNLLLKMLEDGDMEAAFEGVNLVSEIYVICETHKKGKALHPVERENLAERGLRARKSEQPRDKGIRVSHFANGLLSFCPEGIK